MPRAGWPTRDQALACACATGALVHDKRCKRASQCSFDRDFLENFELYEETFEYQSCRASIGDQLL
jgi:hypothetical protein